MVFSFSNFIFCIVSYSGVFIMNIELTEKERTALSILLGLRQKFSREANKNPQTYSSHALEKLFSELMKKISRNELRYFENIVKKSNERKERKEDFFDVVDKIADKSRKRRYDWNVVFGTSLTRIILKKKKEGLSIEQAYKELENDKRVTNFILKKPNEKRRILENLKNSVNSRYIENNTAKEVMEEDGRPL